MEAVCCAESDQSFEDHVSLDCVERLPKDVNVRHISDSRGSSMSSVTFYNKRYRECDGVDIVSKRNNADR